MFDLYIGNKNYSSWSLRAWLLLKHFSIPFREHMVSVAGRNYNPALKPLAGNARVPSPNTCTSAFPSVACGRPMPVPGRARAASRRKCMPVLCR